MAERIEDVNILTQSSEDLKAYAIYVARARAIPDMIDGLKPVIRKILWCAANDFRGQGFIKTSNIMGQVIRKYNPHGDASVLMAIRNMINDFSTKIPTMDGSGSWGHKSNPSPSAPRYTECKISDFAVDVFIQDIYDDKRSTDWSYNYDNKYLEPNYLPAKIPTLLVLGQLGIAVGMKSSIPSHNLGEVIDTTIALMKDPKAKFCLVPDECMPCEILETNFQKINDTGMGSYIAQGIVDVGEYDKHPALFVRSLPDFTFFDSIKETIIKLVESKKIPYISDMVSKSRVDFKTKKNIMEEVIILTKGADPYFVREFLYANTGIRQTRQVKIITLKDNRLAPMNYRQYLLNFIDFRRNAVFRKHNALLQRYQTLIHEREAYLKAMTSGEIDKIIKLIRNQKTSEDNELMEYLINKLRITSLQAKFLMNAPIKKLSAGNLARYKQELAGYQKKEKEILDIILNPKNIDKYIIHEMLEIKKKYNKPRLCKVVSSNEAKGIAQGVFKLIFTKRGFVRKLGENDAIGSFANDEFLFSIMVNNTEDVLVFSDNGKVFRIPVSKIPLYARGSNGIDVRILNKYITSTIISAAREETLKNLATSKKFKNFIFVVSRNGYIKKMDLDDIINAPASGFIYSKLDPQDTVQDIIFGPDKMDILVQCNNKVLRMSAKEVPYLKRSTKGNRASTATALVNSLNFLIPSATEIIVITKNGKVNKLSLEYLPRLNRGRAGQTVIKLMGDDEMLCVLPCNENQTLIVNDGRALKKIPVSNIKAGNTSQPGVAMFSNPIKAVIGNG